jgi:hypothetical protein
VMHGARAHCTSDDNVSHTLHLLKDEVYNDKLSMHSTPYIPLAVPQPSRIYNRQDQTTEAQLQRSQTVG